MALTGLSPMAAFAVGVFDAEPEVAWGSVAGARVVLRSSGEARCALVTARAVDVTVEGYGRDLKG